MGVEGPLDAVELGETSGVDAAVCGIVAEHGCVLCEKGGAAEDGGEELQGEFVQGVPSWPGFAR